MKFAKGLWYTTVTVALISISYIFYDDYTTGQNFEKLAKWSEENKISIDKNNVEEKQFKIEYDQKEWDLLVKKLELSRYFKPLSEEYVSRNDFGFDPEYTQELVEYWKTNFNWKAQVEYLNKYPQYKIKINDTIIHYLRVITNKKNDVSTPIPVLLLDGWPGSFFGFYKMIDYINNTFEDNSFDIIVPTIPGFGYSTPLSRPLDTTDTAQLFDALMRYAHRNEKCKYYIHGEDWGSVITGVMAKLYPQRVKAIHITMPSVPLKIYNPYVLFYSLLGEIWPNSFLTNEEVNHNFTFSLSKTFFTLLKKTGYFHLQATKPDTLGHGLTDSPSGLLAYLLEKYALGSFGFGNVIGVKGYNFEKAFTKDELLTIVTYYWMTNSITSSCRFYRTQMLQLVSTWPKTEISDYKISKQVPVAIQYFANEVWTYPFALLQKTYLNVKRFNIFSNGGHFAGFENPKVSADDFIEFIHSLE